MREKPFWFLYCERQINQSSRNKPFSFVKNWICYIRQVKYNTFIRLEKWNWLCIKHQFIMSRFAATWCYCICVGDYLGLKLGPYFEIVKMLEEEMGEYIWCRSSVDLCLFWIFKIVKIDNCQSVSCFHTKEWMDW